MAGLHTLGTYRDIHRSIYGTPEQSSRKKMLDDADPEEDYLSGGTQPPVNKWLRRDLEKSREEYDRVIEKNKELLSEISAMEASHAEEIKRREALWDSERNTLNTTLKSAQDAREAFRSQVAEVKAQKEALAKGVGEREDQLRYAHAQLDKANALNATLQESVKQTEQALKTAMEGGQDALKELAESAELARREREAASQVLQKLQTEKQQEQEQKETLRKRLQGAAHAAMMVERLQGEVEALRTSNQALEVQREQDRASLANLHYQVQALTEKANKHEHDMVKTEVELEALHQQRERATQTITELQAKLGRMRDDQDKSCKLLVEMEMQRDTEVGALHGELEMERLQAKLAMEKAEEQWTAHIHRETEALQQTRSKLRESLESIDQLQTEKEMLETDKKMMDMDRQEMIRRVMNTSEKLQLVCVAPCVNVGLGSGGSRLSTAGMQAVESRVAGVIENEIIPNYVKVYSQPLPTGAAAIPPGYVEKLIEQMQKQIGEHLRPILAQAWKQEKK